MQKTKKRDGWGGISKEGYGLSTPITAWAVELDGKIYPENVLSTRAVARYIRNVEARSEFVKKVTVRKVILQVVPGR